MTLQSPAVKSPINIDDGGRTSTPMVTANKKGVVLWWNHAREPMPSQSMKCSIKQKKLGNDKVGVS